MGRVMSAPTTPEQAAQTYAELGPLTDDLIELLRGRTSDVQRYQTLVHWYGPHAAKVAWQEYQERAR